MVVAVVFWTVSADAAEVDAARVESPAYFATTLYDPLARLELVKTATPEAIGAVPRLALLFVSVKVMVSALGGAGLTVAVNVTVAPAATVDGEIVSEVVVGVSPLLLPPQLVTKTLASTEPKPVA